MIQALNKQTAPDLNSGLAGPRRAKKYRPPLRLWRSVVSPRRCRHLRPIVPPTVELHQNIGMRIHPGYAFAGTFLLVRQLRGMDLRDDALILDTGDDSDRPAAVLEGIGFDTEYSPEALRPDHRRGADPGVRYWAGVAAPGNVAQGISMSRLGMRPGRLAPAGSHEETLSSALFRAQSKEPPLRLGFTPQSDIPNGFCLTKYW